MERTLNITIKKVCKQLYDITISDPETSDSASKTICYSPNGHGSFNDWIGNEIYDWITFMEEGSGS